MRLPKICGGFLNVTQRCNLACKYCFVVQQPMEMAYEVAKDAADFYAKNALIEAVTPSITFFGGEPMLRYDDIVKPLIEYIRATYGDYDLDITTNGTLLDEEKLRFFKDNHVGMLLSVDGNKRTQDLLRVKHDGSGSFDDIDVKTYLKYNPYGTFRSTLDPRNVKYMYENYLWAEQEGYKSCTMIINVFDEWTEENYKDLQDNLEKISDYILKNKNAMKFNEIDKFKDVSKDLNDLEYKNKKANLPACGSCGLAANRFGSVGASGDVYSCQEMTENKECKDFCIGNIYKGIDDNKRIEIMSKYHIKKVKSSKEGRCKDCKLENICGGGCIINNYFKNKDLNVASEPWCRYQELCFSMYERMVEK